MAGSGRARRFRQARELKQGGKQRTCDFCHADLSLGEPHDPDCDYVETDDPYGEDDGDGDGDAEEW